jgi:hypothetical protein
MHPRYKHYCDSAWAEKPGWLELNYSNFQAFGGTSVYLRAEDKMEWIEDRRTTREEDLLYALFGVVGVIPSANYREGSDRACKSSTSR